MALMMLLRAIGAGDEPKALRLLNDAPGLAGQVAAADHYFKPIEHYLYVGDTALHLAAAAHSRTLAVKLLAAGADVRARNRRGAEPLHYAADGAPGSATWNPAAQEAVIECLVKAGAEANAADKSGVMPLHRAVRTRCAAAVRALLRHGADVHARNGNGSTPLHLAVRTTGRGGSGSDASLAEQEKIIELLLQNGARPTDRDAAGRAATEAASNDRVRGLLRTR